MQDNTRGSFWLAFPRFVFMNCTTVCLWAHSEARKGQGRETEDIGGESVNTALLVKYRSSDVADSGLRSTGRKRNRSQQMPDISFFLLQWEKTFNKAGGKRTTLTFNTSSGEKKVFSKLRLNQRRKWV